MSQKIWRILAATYGGVAAVAVVLYFRWSWVPGVDFDPIGFFWAVGNAGKIVAFLVALGAGGAAAYCMIRAKLG